MLPHEAIWTATVALVPWSPWIAAVVWGLGLLAHGLGRPTWPARAALALLLGFLLGIPLVYVMGLFGDSLGGNLVLALILCALQGAALVVGLALTGRLRMAGFVLAGLAIPTLLYMTAALVEPVLGVAGAGSPSLTLGAVVIGSWAMLLVGVGIALHGDHRPMPDPMAPAGRPGSHRTMSLSKAVFGAASYRPMPPAEALPVLAIVLVLWLLPTGHDLQQVACLVVGLGAALVGTEIELRWMPPGARRALEAYHVIGLRSMEVFKAATGRPAPGRPADMDAWLATPPTPADLRFRPEFLIYRRRFDEARAVIAAMPDDTPLDRGWREQALADLAFRTGSRFDTSRVEAELPGIDDPGERWTLESQVIWAAAEQALADERPDWAAPLLAARERMGADADGIHARVWRTRTRIGALTGAVVAAFLLPAAALLYAAVTSRF